jgi:tetratricopeptide (TPR) repeat protein/predicted Ser/Thr protein kinase
MRPGSHRDRVADPVARTIARANLLRRLAKVETATPRIGRFTVLDKLGEGAHGVVYAAFDPELDRRVALKLLRRDQQRSQERLRREARALARLSHPNVVGVHEVGETEGAIFVAMEFVDGETLDRWLARGQRPDAILEVLIAAGRGLAEAHARGLTHRDFKPSNVMVGRDGRARVTDFGLASVAPSVESEGTLPDDDALGVTQTGVVLGTPAYMAPEQHQGHRADARSDQYSFCLTAWQALLGRHPLATDAGPLPPMELLVEGKNDGPSAWPSPSVSRRIGQALRRGLAVEPSERFEGLPSLLAALSPPPTRSRRWRFAVGAVAVVAAAGSAWGARAQQRPCEDASGQLEGVWDDDARAGVEAAFATSNVGYGEQTFGRIERQLDHYAQQWVAIYADACEATRVRGDQSEAVMDLRMVCLRQSRAELAAVSGVLGRAGEDVVRVAHDVVGGLPPLSRCDDIEALQSDVPLPPPAEAEAVAQARAALARAKVEVRAGRFEVGLGQVEDAERSLRGVAYAPVKTELALRRGAVLERLSDFEGAERELREALRSASRWHQWDEAFEASTLLVVVVGDRLGKPKEATRYVDLADGLATDDPVRVAQLRTNLGTVHLRAGLYDDAEAEYRRALDSAEDADESLQGPLQIPTIRALLAQVLYLRGDYAAAEVEARQSLESFETVLGQTHPDVGSAAATLGLCLVGRGDPGGAEVQFRRALQITEDTVGPEHLHAATGYSNLGLSLVLQGRYAEARPQFARALRIYVDTVGPEHPDVAQIRYNLAVTMQAELEFEAARDELIQTASLQRKQLEPGHPTLGTTLVALATTHCELEEYEQSDAAFTEAREILAEHLGAEHPTMLSLRSNWLQCRVDRGEGQDLDAAEDEARSLLATRLRLLGDEHPDVAHSRLVLAKILLAGGRANEAAEEAERAHGSFERNDGADRYRAQSAFLLARALAEAGREPKRARALAAQAQTTYAAMGWRDDVETVESWLTRSPTGR